MKRLVLAAGLLAATYASASGDYGPSFTRYKAYSAPDIALEHFQEGALGVLQPGMQRVYLYTAWRAIILGPKIKTASGLPGGLARADGSAFGNGWGRGGAERQLEQEWQRLTGVKDTNFYACPASASLFALQTFKTASKRLDATPARLKMWVNAQELVFAACKAEDEARYNTNIDLGKVLVAHVLSDKEPAYWRQLRDYQRAATLFHAEQYHGSTPLFDKIGSVPEHPMRDLGRYLGLRSQVRNSAMEGSNEANFDAMYAALQQRAKVILADPSLAARHEATRGTLRSIRTFLLPGTVYMELNQLLADPAADPFQNDRLGDWVAAMRIGDAADHPNSVAQHMKGAREKFDFVNWIDTLHDCAYRRSANETSCSAPAARALAQWQRTKTRPWLSASLMLSASLTPALEAAAVAVQPADPDYLTVRYHLSRLCRLAGRANEARAISDAALKLELSPATRNLFREERFAVATSVADAAPYMLRVDIDMSSDGEPPVQGFNDDALHWMSKSLATSDMLILARGKALGTDARARLASAAWMRAELLGKADVALQAVDVIEQLVPSMKKALVAYRSAPTRAERHHLMLLTAIKFGLEPNLSETVGPIKAVAKHEVTASNWCRFTPPGSTVEDKKPFPWLLPAPPAVGQAAIAVEELEKLKPLKTSTGYIGEHVLARADASKSANANDPDLPWLLHVVVASTRGGCLDADSKKLSRDAFNVLRKRYPGDEWTKKTPYFF